MVPGRHRDFASADDDTTHIQAGVVADTKISAASGDDSAAGVHTYIFTKPER